MAAETLLHRVVDDRLRRIAAWPRLNPPAACRRVFLGVLDHDGKEFTVALLISTVDDRKETNGFDRAANYVATIEPLNRWSDLQGRDDVMPQLCELEVLEKENPPRRSTRVGQMSSYRTGDGLIFQISVAYSTIVRSLENLPEHATLMIAFRHQASGILYNAASSW